jgi:hypothetical protein
MSMTDARINSVLKNYNTKVKLQDTLLIGSLSPKKKSQVQFIIEESLEALSAGKFKEHHLTISLN